MNKAYSRINFQNAPSTATPLNATNLNKMDKAINDLDDRIIELSGYQEEAQEAAEQASSSASAAAKAAETATADAEARVNAIIEGLEVYTKEESDKKFASVIKQVATGSPILIKDGAGVEALDFKGKGRSTQNGTPTPDSPIAIKSVADSGYFDGELLQGFYSGTGVFTSNSTYVCSRNPIPCNSGDTIKIAYGTTASEIAFIFYDKDMAFINRPYGANATEYETTTPTNAKYVHFYLREPNISITPTTVKKIVVTINDTYALKVKSVGKNLFDISKIPNTANMTNNQNGTLTITNSYSNNTYKKLSELTELKIGQTYTLSFSSTSEYQFIYLSTTSEKWENGMSLKMTQHRLDSAVYFYGNTSGVITISNIQIEENTEVTDYEPYKETVTYIPLNEPLRSSLDGTVADEASLTEVTRKMKEVVFDGSDDEGWTLSKVVGDYGYFHISTNGKIYTQNEQPTVLCDSFTVLSGLSQYNNPTQDCILSNNGLSSNARLWFITKQATDLESWKTYLSTNPITVQYELAEPITETIEPVDIVTYDNVTYLTASDNAEMEVTYATDTKSYIDSKFAELHAALVNML